MSFLLIVRFVNLSLLLSLLIRYMEETEKTKPHAVDRAWNLLKPNDQRVIMNVSCGHCDQLLW